MLQVAEMKPRQNKNVSKKQNNNFPHVVFMTEMLPALTGSVVFQVRILFYFVIH